MLKFFRRLLFSILGALFTAGFIVLITVIVIASIIASNDKTVDVKENSILVLDLNTPIVERAPENPLADLIGDSPISESKLGLNKILKNIKKASADENIVGIYLNADQPVAGLATLAEIRNALKSFQDSGKFVHSFAASYTQKGYFLSSVAQKIYVAPQGGIDLRGLAAQRMFFKGTLEKLGVEAQIFKHGKFKSAVEPFMRENMSEPARKQTETYLASMWGYMKEAISTSRSISVNEIDQLAESAEMYYNPQFLLDHHLVDALWYKDQVLEEMKKLTDTDASDDLEAVSLGDYNGVVVPKQRKGLVRDKIAVIYAEGAIDNGKEGINSEDLSRTIREARRDSSIKAVVFRVNSPGGSGLGSDIIWREVLLTKQVKPVVVSMGDYAASGGYYISCCADAIVASPVTLTGSIGVFGYLPNAKKLFNQKLGITFDGVKTNKYADMMTISRPLNSSEKAIIQTSIEEFYKVFISRCAEGRNTTTQAIDEIGQGRVWSGENALDINLVDRLGGIDDAIALAKEKAGLEKYKIKEMPEELSSIEEMLKGMKAQAKAFAAEAFLGVDYQEVELMNQIKEIQPIQARLPYLLEIN